MDLAKLLAPRDASFLSIARQIHREREDLQRIYPDPDGADYLKWLGVHGVLEYGDRLSRFYPPMPPENLRRTACGGPTELTHLCTSIEDFQTIADLWEIYAGVPFEEIRAVYDFGCGCGRMLRWFALALPEADCVGSDVRKASIAWCRANLRGCYFANETQPPIELTDESIDLVIALSVFSHLRLTSNLAWIRELCRVCRPDGRIVISTLGAFALAVATRSAEHQSLFAMTADDARRHLRSLQSERFVFHPLPADVVHSADGVEREYGEVFLTEAFVQQRWSPWAEIVGCVPVGLSQIHDVYVLRPHKAPRAGAEEP